MMRGREELENTYTIRVSNKLYRNILGRHFNYHQLAVMLHLFQSMMLILRAPS
jgi:hypothetical protein